MVEINLIPDVKKELLRARKIRLYVVGIAIFVGIIFVSVVALIAIVWGGQELRQSFLNDSIDKEERKIQGVKDLSSALTIQSQLRALKEQHSNKTINSRLFPLLDVINPASPNNITVSSVNVDSESNQITIDAQAVNGYEAAEVFKKTILGTMISTNDQDPLPLTTSVVDSNMGIFQDSTGKRILGFTFTFKYHPALFEVSSGNTLIQRPGISNVTDSYLRVPEGLFRDRVDIEREGR